MTCKTHRPTAPPRFAWLLWVALLVPLAQFAANWHSQSHWTEELNHTSGSKHALAGDHCDLCLTAAGVTGGSATGALASLPLALARYPAPPMRTPRARSQAVSLAYQSRAPPHAFR